MTINNHTITSTKLARNVDIFDMQNEANKKKKKGKWLKLRS